MLPLPLPHALLGRMVSPTAVIHSRSSSVETSMESEEMMLEVDSSPRKHICSSTGSRQTAFRQATRRQDEDVTVTDFDKSSV